MVYTINAEIRSYLKLDSTDYSDPDVKNKIERALAFLNAKLGESYTIADYDNANTSSSPYDELIIFYSLWHIHSELYKQSIIRSDSGERSAHLSTIYKEMFFEHLVACYPGVAEVSGGKWHFATRSFAGQDIGYADSRYDATDAPQFDRTL